MSEHVEGEEFATPTPPRPVDLILDKAEEFTRTEVVCLTAWLVAAEGGDLESARLILRTGLLAEHYRSLLSEDPAQITVGQSITLKGLLDEFNRALLRIPVEVRYP